MEISESDGGGDAGGGSSGDAEAQSNPCPHCQGSRGHTRCGGFGRDGKGDGGVSPAAMHAFDELVRRWEAQPPSGLLHALFEDATIHGVRRLRRSYAQAFADAGLRLPAEAG